MCRVENTRCPVSAAASAACTVSMSRISPIRITSGSWRIAVRIAETKLSVSTPTSRWLTDAIRSMWMTSIGSSIVRMWQRRVALMWSIIAARVVVFPVPVGPVRSTRPRGWTASWRITGGRPSSSNEGLPTRTSRNTSETASRWLNAFTRKRARSEIW